MHDSVKKYQNNKKITRKVGFGAVNIDDATIHVFDENTPFE